MFKYQKFLISSTDHFDPASYPFLQERIAFAKKELTTVPSMYRTEMLVSFLKDHCINSKWVADNPRGAELISSKALPLADIEELFEERKIVLYLKMSLNAISKNSLMQHQRKCDSRKEVT